MKTEECENRAKKIWIQNEIFNIKDNEEEEKEDEDVGTKYSRCWTGSGHRSLYTCTEYSISIYIFFLLGGGFRRKNTYQKRFYG